MKKYLLNLSGAAILGFSSLAFAGGGMEEVQSVDTDSSAIVTSADQSYSQTLSDVGSYMSETAQWAVRKVITSPAFPVVIGGALLLALIAEAAAVGPVFSPGAGYPHGVEVPDHPAINPPKPK